MRKPMARTITVATMIMGVFALLMPASAYAHVSVKPAEAIAGEYQTFAANVPNEKEISVTALRLVVPTDVKSVTPTAKQGWEITTKKTGENVTEIIWSGGTIDAGLRDEFTFSAKVPADEGSIIWKAYQTYQDGSIVAWDQEPADDHSHDSKDEAKGPYSVTSVNAESESEAKPESEVSTTLAFVLSGIALILGMVALRRTIKK